MSVKSIARPRILAFFHQKLYCQRFLIVFVLVGFPSLTYAQEASDIWLGKLNLGQNKPITDLVRLTNTPRYTNQPYFFSNDDLYFTQSEGEGDNAQTDIFYFSLALGTTKNITQSTQSEYSPTPVPNESAMSVIRVNAQGKQELFKLDLQGKPIEHLVPAIEPVGYQVWLSSKALLLFVLGEPHTLQLTQSSPESIGEVLDDSIGASLFRYAKTDWFLYSRTSEDGHWIKSYNSDTGNIKRVAQLPLNTQYFAISPSGIVLASDGSELYQRRISQSDGRLSSVGEWESIKMRDADCHKGISRIAISPDESMVALVCTRN